MMAKRKLYYWQALRPDGTWCSGERIGNSKHDIYHFLLSMGYQPLRLKTGAYLTARYWRGPQLQLFIQQLATLLQAGLPLLDALDLLSSQHEKPAWRCLIQEVRLQVTQGRALSNVLADYPDIFPPIFSALVTVGELTGKLDECCAQLADYQEARQKMAGSVIKALRYPAFIIVSGLMIALLMLTLVLPEFASLYSAFNAPLPLLTRMMLALSRYLGDYSVWLMGLSATVVLYYQRLRRKSPHWQRREHQLLLRLPLLCELIRSHCLSQIFYTLSMTQQAGLTLPVGLSAAATLNNRVYQHSLIAIQHQLEQGIPLGQAMQSYPQLYPSPCEQFIRVGEESGALDTLFTRLAHWYESHTKQRADMLTQTLEPVLLTAVGGLVGILVIAMYLPIFQLGNMLAGA